MSKGGPDHNRKTLELFLLNKSFIAQKTQPETGEKQKDWF